MCFIRFIPIKLTQNSLRTRLTILIFRKVYTYSGILRLIWDWNVILLNTIFLNVINQYFQIETRIEKVQIDLLNFRQVSYFRK